MKALYTYTYWQTTNLLSLYETQDNKGIYTMKQDAYELIDRVRIFQPEPIVFEAPKLLLDSFYEGAIYFCIWKPFYYHIMRPGLREFI